MVPQTILTHLVTRGNHLSGDKWSGNLKNAKQAFLSVLGMEPRAAYLPACLHHPAPSIPSPTPLLLRCPFVDIVNPVTFLLLAA